MPVTHALSNLAGAAATSMQAIELWLDVIADNMAGAPRVGFRRAEVTFRGSGVSQIANNLGGGVPKAEVVSGSIQVATTTKVFEEGKINSSFSDAHFAITGNEKTFFRLRDSASNLYYTRDGEFVRNGSNYVHVTSGLFLATAAGTNESANPSAIPGSITATTRSVQINQPELLEYSPFGTTIFKIGTAVSAGVPSPTARIIGRALESSNTSITLTIPQLTLAQKMFSAFAKIISSDNDNTDTVLQLVR